jgi:hypothetical protein
METLAMIRKVFGEEIMRPYKESPNSPAPKNTRQIKSKIKSILIIFFDIKGIVHKESVLEGQTVNSAYHRDPLW